MLQLPSLNADIIDNGVATGDTGYIVAAGGRMLLVTLVQIAASITATYFSAGRRDGRRARPPRPASSTTSAASPPARSRRFGAPSLITRNTNDVQQVQMLVLMTFTMLVTAPIMAVGGIVMAIREGLALSWLLLVSVPVLVFAVGFIVSRMIPGFRRVQERTDDINRVVREQIAGIRVVRAFVRERSETARFATTNDELTDAAIWVGKWMVLMFPTVMLVFNASSVAVLWFGAGPVDDGSLQIGSLTAFLSYLMQILMAVMMATFVGVMAPRAAVSADRIGEVLDTASSVVPPHHPVTAVAVARPGRAARRDVLLPRGRGARAPRRVVHGRARARRRRSSAAPEPARRRSSTSSRGCSTSPAAPSSSTASTCATSTRSCCGVASASSPRPPTCSAARSPATCATAGPRRPTRRCGTPSRWPRPPTSCGRCRTACRRPSPRAARTSRAGSGSAWRSPGR